MQCRRCSRVRSLGLSRKSSLDVTAYCLLQASPKHSAPLFSLAFPYDNDTPPQRPQLTNCLSVSLDVLDELLCPELDARLGIVSSLAATMSVPEAAIHKHHRPVSHQNDIWPSWQILPPK